MPEEEWIVVDGTHEAIIDQKTWDTAQDKLTVESVEIRVRNNFAGLVKCTDCGYALAYTHNKNPAISAAFITSRERVLRSHFITYEALYQAVLSDVRRMAKAAASMDKHLLHRLKTETAGLLDKRERQAEKECAQMSSRIDELEIIIGKLYEDNALERISPDRFQRLLGNYEAEQKELQNKRDSLQRSYPSRKQKPTKPSGSFSSSRATRIFRN